MDHSTEIDVISLSHENRFFFENPFIVPTAENKIEITHPRNIHPPTMSNDHQVDIKSEAVKKRFESDFLPKYEILWRAMRNTSKNSKTRTPIRTRAPLEAINFIQAINKKATVSFSIDRGHGGECGYGCAPPFLDEKISKTSNQRVLIDLVDSSSSDDDSENKNETICLLSDSEDEYQSLETYEAQKTRVPAYDELSSDESSFELEFDYGYDENNSKINEIDDLIESTNKKKPLHDGKENLTRRKNRLYVSKSAFQKRRRALTTELFAEFNRKAFGGQLESVEVIWSTKLRTTAGQTRLKRQYTDMRPGNPVKRLATIELSTKVLTDQERLEATLLHEMVHAAAWIVDSVSKPPHGRCFWKWANCAMENVSCIPITTTHTYEIQYKYAWACSSPSCNFIVKRQSRSVDVDRHCCGQCQSKLVEVNAGSSDQPYKKRAGPSGYNLFVKEQSKVIREKFMSAQRARGKSNPKVSQADVMRECARIWREKKEDRQAP